ncbi:hypothetical protein, partial [Pseudomonas sp. FW306-2-11AC]|uniref:hypothetical protein n=1 Tax=Pseudomonas sp. FW306-2-11AC TaxID=2070656 RepID=UPI001C4450CD
FVDAQSRFDALPSFAKIFVSCRPQSSHDASAGIAELQFYLGSMFCLANSPLLWLQSLVDQLLSEPLLDLFGQPLG